VYVGFVSQEKDVNEEACPNTALEAVHQENKEIVMRHGARQDDVSL